MAMTNDMIIFLERVKLMKEGIISGNGEVAEIEINGKIQTVEMPEEIHTYQRWKSLGYQVKRGEKAIAQFMIWKYSSRKFQTEEGEEKEKSGCFMKKSSFFKMSQVELISA